MTLVPLVGTLYFMVSGGPYGLEELAAKVGFAPAIALLVLVPIVWSVPTALMVGELAAAVPEEGGYYAWVRRAMGPFWGAQEAWLSLAASVFDMAIYPTLFVLYLSRLAPALGHAPARLGALVVAAAAAINLAGAQAVGEGSAVTTVLLLAPFAVLSVLVVLVPGALPTLGHPGAPGSAALGMATATAAGTTTLATTGAAPPLDVAGGVVVAMWNYMGWDNASTVAGEVHRPQWTYPRAVLAAVALVTLTYVVPFAAMAFAHVDPTGWDTGAWADAGRGVGGAWLAAAIVLGGMASAFAMQNALCLSYSRVPAALADDGLLPRVLARRVAKTGVPWVSVLVCSVAWTLSLGLSFDRLLSLDILLYGTSLILEFVALVVLRLREPDLPRPFRVPGGLPVAVGLGIGPLLLLGFALSISAGETVAGMNGVVFGLAVMLVGPAMYFVGRRGSAARLAR